MQDSVLAPWRDLAIVLLVIPMIIVVLVPAVLFYFSIRGIRAVKRRIYTPLLTARLWALRIQNSAERASRASVALPIAMESAEARVRGTVRSLAEWLGITSI